MRPIKDDNNQAEQKRTRRKFSEFRTVEEKQIERSSQNVSARQPHVATKKPTDDSVPLEAKYQQEWCMKLVPLNGHMQTDLIFLKKALIDVYAGEIRRLYLPSQPKTVLVADTNENNLYVRSAYIHNATNIRSAKIDYDFSICDISDFVGSSLLNILLAEGDNKPDNVLVGEDGKLKFPDNDGGFAELGYQDYNFRSGISEKSVKLNQIRGINYSFNETDLVNVPNLPNIPIWKSGEDFSHLFVKKTSVDTGIFAPDRWFLDNVKNDGEKDKSRADTLDRLKVTDQQKSAMKKQRFEMLFKIAVMPNEFLKDIFLNAVTYSQIAHLHPGGTQLMSEEQFKQFRDGLISYFSLRRQDFIKTAFKVPGFREFFLKEMNNDKPNSLLATTAQQLEDFSGKKPHKNTSLYFAGNALQDVKKTLKEEAYYSYLYHGHNYFDQIYTNAVQHFKDTIQNLSFWQFFTKRRSLAVLTNVQAELNSKIDWSPHQKTLYLTFMMTLQLSKAPLDKNYFSDLSRELSIETRMAGPTKAVIEQARNIGQDANYREIILKNPIVVQDIFSKAFSHTNIAREFVSVVDNNQASSKIFLEQLKCSQIIKTEFNLYASLYAYQTTHPDDMVFKKIINELPKLTEEEQRYLLYTAYLASCMYDSKSSSSKALEKYLINYLTSTGHALNRELNHYDNLLAHAPQFVIGSKENRRSLVLTFYQLFKGQDILFGTIRTRLSRFFSRWIYPFETREQGLSKSFVLIQSIIKNANSRLVDIMIPRKNSEGKDTSEVMSAASYAIDMYSYRRPNKYTKSLRQIESVLDSFNQLKDSEVKDGHRHYFLWVVYQASYRLEKNSLFTRHLQRILGTMVSEPERFRAMSFSERHAYLAKQDLFAKFNVKTHEQENMQETIAKVSQLLKRELNFLKFGIQTDNEMTNFNDWAGVRERVLKREDDSATQFIKNLDVEYTHYVAEDNELRDEVVQEIFTRKNVQEWGKKVSTIKLKGLIYEELDHIPTNQLESAIQNQETHDKMIDDLVAAVGVEVDKHLLFIKGKVQGLERDLLTYVDEVRLETQVAQKAELSETKINSIKQDIKTSLSEKTFPEMLDLANNRYGQLTDYKADLNKEIKLALTIEKKLLLYIDKTCSKVQNEQNVIISKEGINAVKESMKNTLSKKSLSELINFFNDKEHQLTKYKAELEKEIRLAPLDNAGISYGISLKP